MKNEALKVILASASPIRAKLLQQAGVEVTVLPARVDEDDIKTGFRAEGASVTDTAIALAEIKALSISRRVPGALVIGADQILDLDGLWFDKPGSREAARHQLTALRGKSHQLVSAAVVALNGSRIWGMSDAATLEMRLFTPEFLDGYLEAAGDGILSSVGAYHLEGLGAQLFSNIRGDYFTILGLPLLPLLGFLRGYGVIAA